MTEDLTSYPTDHIVFSCDRANAGAVAQSLADAGHGGDSLKVITDEKGVEFLETDSEGDGVLHKLGRILARFGDEHMILTKIQDEVEQGSVAMAVHVESDEDKEAVADMLQGVAGVRHLSYVGSATVEELMVVDD